MVQKSTSATAALPLVIGLLTTTLLVAPNVAADHVVARAFTLTEAYLSTVCCLADISLPPSPDAANPEWPTILEVTYQGNHPAFFRAFQDDEGEFEGRSVYGCRTAHLTEFDPHRTVRLQLNPLYPPYAGENTFEFALAAELGCPVRVPSAGTARLTYSATPQPLPVTKHYLPSAPAVAFSLVFHPTGFAPSRLDVTDRLGGPVRFAVCVNKNLDNDGRQCDDPGDPFFFFCGTSATFVGFPPDKEVLAWTDNYPLSYQQGSWPCPATTVHVTAGGRMTLVSCF